MKQTEYLIIGAGIVGCSAAYLLTKDGKKVTVVDKSYPCNEASGVNCWRNGTSPAASEIFTNAYFSSGIMGYVSKSGWY